MILLGRAGLVNWVVNNIQNSKPMFSGGTGIAASSSTFRPHVGMVIGGNVPSVVCYTAWYGSTSL